MANSAGLRHRAHEQHMRLRGLCGAHGHPLIPADVLLKAAEIETGFWIQALPAGDPLLSGAQAFLDRDSEMIWYASGAGLNTERQRFAQAHEFAHYWLHPDVSADPCLPEDTPETYMPPSSAGSAAQAEEHYSPQERREREANLFAAELLLPAPFLRQAFVERGMRAEQIAGYTGLSETCVLTQLAYALLIPSQAPGGREVPPGESDRPAAPVVLDPSQEEAARIAQGPALIDAGPGTGKTRTLTARIVHLLRDRSVPPENILALTFSNRAAEEMSERLRRTIGETADRLWIGTFHALGFELLRKEGHRIGLPVRPTLVEPADAMTLLERHFDLLDLREFEYLHNPVFPFPDILDCISRAKDELKSPEDYRQAAEAMAEAAHTEDDRTAANKAAEVAHVYDVYQTLLRANGLVDYGDLISRAVELLELCPDVREQWQRQYPHILADEYQDVNRATARLLQLLAGNGNGFWAVGDLRQAIYRFRGASPANIRQFEADFPGGRRLSLLYNYRSRPGLIRVFGAFASEMGSGIDDSPGWNASRTEGVVPAVALAVTQDENAQADWLAEQIARREEGGLALRDQAILVTTNRQASELAELLQARAVPVHHIGSLFDRPEVKDLIALLSLASEPEGTSLTRVAKFREIAIPRDDVGAILQAARHADKQFPAALQWALEHAILSEEGRRGLRRLCDTLQPLVYRGDAWMLLSRYLFETSDYLAPFIAQETAAHQQERLAIYQLLLTVQQMTRRLSLDQRENQRSAFLNRLRRLLQLRQSRSARAPDEGDSIDAVRIMTVHQSKGLEFPVVYLPNLVKGQFPARGRGKMTSLPGALVDGANDESAQSADLFFVALSRARDELLLSRTLTWNGKPVEASALLQRIERALGAEGATQSAILNLRQGGAESRAIGPALSPNVIPAVEQVAAIPSRVNARPASSIECAADEAADAFIDENAAEAGEKPEISLSGIRQYQSCPRQYYYRRVLHLQERGEESAYRTFDRHLQDTLDWLQAERAAGRAPAVSDLQAEFRARWPVGAPEEETALVRVLRERANTLLALAQPHFTQVAHVPVRREFRASLESGAIRLRCDEVETGKDGRIQVTQHLHRRPKKDDHTADSLALLRLAARQAEPDRPVQIALFSTATGETREVKEDPRWEPKRVEKFETALRDLAQGRFPPRPSETECATCPFFFICPS